MVQVLLDNNSNPLIYKRFVVAGNVTEVVVWSVSRLLANPTPPPPRGEEQLTVDGSKGTAVKC